jgi:hypothetical protein
VPRVASTYIAQRLAGEPRMGKPTNITSSSIDGNIDRNGQHQRPESGDITADYATATTTATAANSNKLSSINLPIVTTSKTIGVISDTKYSSPLDNTDSYSSNTNASRYAHLLLYILFLFDYKFCILFFTLCIGGVTLFLLLPTYLVQTHHPYNYLALISQTYIILLVPVVVVIPVVVAILYLTTILLLAMVVIRIIVMQLLPLIIHRIVTIVMDMEHQLHQDTQLTLIMATILLLVLQHLDLAD